MIAAWQELLHRLFQDLEERNNHDNGEDEDADGLETSTPDREAFLEPLQLPSHKPVCGPYDERAEEVEGRIDEGSDE